MGDGILASENDRVALPGWSGGAPCTAKLGPGREGTLGNFQSLVFLIKFEARDSGRRDGTFTG